MALDGDDPGPDWQTVACVIVLIGVVSVVSIVGFAWLLNALHSFGVDT